MSGSIQRRLLLSSLLVLAAFLGLAGVALDRAFAVNIETSARQQLEAHLYTLLAAADESGDGRMRLPPTLSAPAFNRPDSGLYASVGGEQGDYRWRSESLLGRTDLPSHDLPAGQSRYRVDGALTLFEQGIAWEDNDGRAIDYHFTIALDRGPLEQQQRAFRNTLWQWLGGLALGLLLAQLVLVRWGLRPLRAMSVAVGQLERGESQRIEGPVARELQGLADNLNSLVAFNHQRQERVRHALADLAHSMKTPLAVLRGAASESTDGGLAASVKEQTRRIDEIVTYQRQRAAVAGGTSITRPVDVRPILDRLCASLAKVNRGRSIDCQLDLPGTFHLRADPGDLFELFGNLLENAFRHCRRQVRVGARQTGDILSIGIEDDGDGIESADAERLLRRGERADQLHPGEGIGLAVVSEICRQYGVELSISRSDLGGARLCLHWPG